MLLAKEIIGRSESKIQLELHDGRTPVLNRKYVYGTKDVAEGLLVLAPGWYLSKLGLDSFVPPRAAEVPPMIDELVCDAPPLLFRTTPWEHQLRAYHQSARLKADCLNMAMGTGKSKVALDLAASRARIRQINKLLVIAPVNLKRNWYNQVLLHDAYRSAETGRVLLFGDKTDEDEAELLRWLRDPNYGIAICGLESLSTDKFGGRAYRAAMRTVREQKCMLVIDECHKIKGGDANRTINAKSLAQWTPFRNTMTGTNITHSLGDLFHPYWLLSPKIIGYPRESQFFSNHVITEPIAGSSRRKIVMYVGVEHVAARIAPYTVQCTKEDALDLPEKVYKSRYVTLTYAQREAYDEAKTELLGLMDQRNDFTEYDILRLFTVLQQIVSGYRADIKRTWSGPKYITVPVPQNGYGSYLKCNPDPNAHMVKEERIVKEYCTWEDNPKAQEVLHVINASGGEQFVIWCKYRKEVSDVVAALTAYFGEDQVCQLHGGIKQRDRDQHIDRFKAGARFFVSLPQAGGEGLNGLECSHHAIYYSNSFKYGERVQSEDRQHRPGQTNKVTYLDLWTDTGIDRIIQRCLEKKEDLDLWVKRALAESTHEILKEL